MPTKLCFILALFITLTVASCAHTSTKTSASNEPPEQIQLIDLDYAPEQQLLKKVVSASPKIHNLNEGLIGTGIFIFKNEKKQGFVLSALHVIGLSTKVNVQFFNVDESDSNYIREVVTVPGVIVDWTIAKKDLVLIKIDKVPAGIEPLPLATRNALTYDQMVWKFGFNEGYKWTHGLYLARENRDTKNIRQRVLLPVNKGASGGPIVNDRGELIGVLQSFYESENEVVTIKKQRLYEHHLSTGWFLPINAIHEFLKGKLK